MMTPGTYLQKRRIAKDLSVDDVAALVRTDPSLGEIDRRAWIARIEDDVAAISADVRASLIQLFPFSMPVLRWLIDLRNYGPIFTAPAICQICGCSQFDACFDGHATCSWTNAATDLCTACIGKDLPHGA